jgi:hypothetical protein
MSYQTNPHQPNQYPPPQPYQYQQPQQYQQPNPPAEDDDEDEGGKWWQFMLYGVAMFGFATWLYIYLSQKEQDGGRFRIQWMIAIGYDLLGKWGVTGILAGLGAVSILIGTFQLIHRVRAKR